MGIIYCATNKVNGKRYIGQVKQLLKTRIGKHRNDAKLNHCTPFLDAIREFGFDAFEWEILDENVPLHLLNEFERDAILVYNTLHPNGYNMQSGGTAGFITSDETKHKIAAAQTGRKYSEESKKKMSESGKKRPPISEETRRKISEGAKNARRLQKEAGKCRPPMKDETRHKIGVASKNMAEESRRKIGDATRTRYRLQKEAKLANMNKQDES